ncbi:hypothetical protein COY15_00545 [Candidatus Roizmanbacteria bacterium CG_4_10_14_0_2_um_filter_39_12]|nr:MAG: hypothetical protein COY15_00545 [Candidatus Roizmanbacteria bacterium CG_4_10_14_0_2_um_filter_39_12]
MKNQTQSNTLKRLEKIMMTNYKSQVSKKKAKTTVGKTLQAPLIPADSTYFGKTIHKVYYNNRWYYSLEDIATMSSPLGLKEIITSLKNDDEYKNDYEEFVIILPTIIKDISKMVEFIDFNGSVWLMKLIRRAGSGFPGSFPRWLEEISKIKSL